MVEVWDNIEPEVCQNLIESMPRRVEAVIKISQTFRWIIMWSFVRLWGGLQSATVSDVVV